jgi:hypothetical protein
LLINYAASFFLDNLFSLFDIPNKNYFVIILIITLNLLLILLYENSQRIERIYLEIKINRKLLSLIAILICIFITVINISSALVCAGSQEFSIINFTSILFLGFVITYILYAKKLITDLIDIALFSILFDISVYAILGFIVWFLGNFGLIKLLTLFFNAALSLYFISIIAKNYLGRSACAARDVFVRITLAGLVEFCMIVATIGALYLQYSVIHQKPGVALLGDEFAHAGFANKLARRYCSWQEAELGQFTMPAYPYFFHLFLVACSFLTGAEIPYLLTKVLPWVLLPLPFLAFIRLAKRLLGERRSVSLAVFFFIITSGFGWIKAWLYAGMISSGNICSFLSQVSDDTCDIIYSMMFPSAVVPVLIDNAVLYTIVSFLIDRSDLDKRSKKTSIIFIISILIIMSLLFHIEKTIIFAFIIAALLIINYIWNIIEISKFTYTAIALIISTFVTVILDILAPLKLYTAKTYLIPMLIAEAIGMMILVLSFVKNKISNVILRHEMNVKKIFIVLYISMLLVIILYEVISNVGPDYRCWLIPFYYFPLKLGVAGILSTIAILMFVKDREQNMQMLLILLAAILAVELAAYHLFDARKVMSQAQGIEEFRYMRDVLWPFIAIAAARGADFLVRLPRKRYVSYPVALGLALMLVTAGPASNLLKVKAMYCQSGVPERAQGMLSFVGALEVPKGSAILSTSLPDAIYSVTGVSVYSRTSSPYWDVLRDSDDIFTAAFLLSYLNISYAVIARNALAQNALQKLLDYFPLVYQDDTFSVYALIPLNHPSFYSNNVLLLPSTFMLGQIYNLSGNVQIKYFADVNDFVNWKPDTIDKFAIFNVKELNTRIYDKYFIIHVQSDVPGNKTVALLRKILEKPIFVDRQLIIEIKFRTYNKTKLLVHILYNDGSMENVIYAGSPFMQSNVWAVARKIIDAGKRGKYIVGFRIGVTNRFDENLTSLRADVEYLAVYEDPVALCSDAIVFMLLSNLNYTIAFSGNTLKGRNIILVNETITDQKIIDVLAKDNRNVIILGKKIESRSAGCIVKAILSYQNAAGINNILAFYECDNGEKITAIEKIKDNIYFVNIYPIITNMQMCSNQSCLLAIRHKVGTIMRFILGDMSSSTFKREFFLKAKGGIKIAGDVEMHVKELLICVNNSCQEEAVGDGVVRLVGNVSLETIGFGYVKLRVQGTLCVRGDCAKMSEYEIFAFVSSIRGRGGLIKFDTLMVSYPFTTGSYNLANYTYYGSFSFRLVPLSNDLILLLPLEKFKL